MDDQQLVQQLRKRDPAAIRQLQESYLPSIWRSVYIRVDGDPHLAEDIVSETVLALIRAIGKDDGGEDTPIEHPAAWMRTVAYRRVQDHYRAAARVKHLIQQVQQTVPQEDTQDATNKELLSERRQEVRNAMDQLPEQHRLAVEWKYIDRLSVREIAKRLQTTEKAAESILYRARRDLREQLSSGGDESENPQASSEGRPPPGFNIIRQHKLRVMSQWNPLPAPSGG